MWGSPTGIARLVAVAAIAGLTAIGGGSAARAAGTERIAAYVIELDVQADGGLKVGETITYDFGSNRKHGIDRTIANRFAYDDTNGRVYPIEGMSAKADGRNAEVDHTTSGDNEVFRIGDPEKYVTGQVTYELEYVVRGAVNTFADHDELYWNAVGTQWQVPIAEVKIDLRGPAAITEVECFAGAYRSALSCENKHLLDGAASFDDSALAAHDGVAVVAALPRGSVRNPGPILEERFRLTPWTGTGVGILAMLAILGALLVGWLVGRARPHSDLRGSAGAGAGNPREESSRLGG